MRSRIILTSVSLITLGLNACSRPYTAADRNKSDSGLSDVGMSFDKSKVPAEVQKRLSKFDLNIQLADIVKAGCSTGPKDVKKADVLNWEQSPVKIPSTSLKSNCQYDLKLALGEDIAGKFVAYYNNSDAGQKITPTGATFAVDVSLVITAEGKKIGLDKLMPDIDSDQNSNVDINVKIGGGSVLSLFGSYTEACAQLKSDSSLYRKSDVTFSPNNEVSVKAELYSASGCAVDKLIITEVSKANYTYTPAGSKLTLASSLSEKSATFSQNYANQSYCERSDFAKGQVFNVMTDSEVCRDHMGVGAIQLANVVAQIASNNNIVIGSNSSAGIVLIKK